LRKLRVGVWIPDQYEPTVGGGFSYFDALLGKITQHTFEHAEVTLIYHRANEGLLPAGVPKHKMVNFPYQIPNPSVFDKSIHKLRKILQMKTTAYDYSKLLKEAKKKLRNELLDVVDLVYYITPSFIIEEVPFIYTLWDLGHLSTYPFPEWAGWGNYEARDKHLRMEVSKAMKILVESETGKKEAQKYLNIHPSRFAVVPLFPSGIVFENVNSIRPEQISEDADFIHYPAQFWPHKNHYNLLLAFKQVLLEYPNLRLILTGSDKGNLDYIIESIKRLNIVSSIVILGFVENENLKWLYQNSKALVMPTFLGPTNMPLLEAAHFGCPVICSDLPGHRELLGENALYVNPTSPTALFGAIIKTIESPVYPVVNTFFALNSSVGNLELVFSELKFVRHTWGK